jgi:hypothetical protein
MAEMSDPWLRDWAISLLSEEGAEIRMAAICSESEDGRLVVKERHLFAVVKTAAGAFAEASAASPHHPDADSP